MNGQNFTKSSHKGFARIGLMGNPSDGFFGKTISLSIKNFWAEVHIEPSDTLRLIPHKIHDPTEFQNLEKLCEISNKDGYMGGLRLLQATCKKFYSHCQSQGIKLPENQNFTLSYDTNIPRQVGLAGSSAIITATLKSLLHFFDLNSDGEFMSREMLPQLILDVEKEELGIQAGLQDRVVQVYEGLVYMDFSQEIMSSCGHGHYEKLNIQSEQGFPTIFLAYQEKPSDSGKIHSDIRKRFDEGDQDVVSTMKQFAKLTEESREILLDGQPNSWSLFGDKMRENFKLRRSIYGDKCLGQANMKMIELGGKFGAPTKFPGSGGAVVGLLLDEAIYPELEAAYNEIGCQVTKIIPNF